MRDLGARCEDGRALARQHDRGRGTGGRDVGDTPMKSGGMSGRGWCRATIPEPTSCIVGTSVTSPAPKFCSAGNDNQYLYHNWTLAMNADTGKIVWYYQHIVDHWDFDHPFERLLVETAVAPESRRVHWINPRVRAGERRKVVTGIPGKTGVVYTLDRETGEFLWATPTVQQNVVQQNRRGHGRGDREPGYHVHRQGQTPRVSQHDGGKNWPAGAYSPLTATRCTFRCRTPA